MPEIIVIKVGTLDGDALERIAPKLETFTSRRAGWVKSVEGAGQLKEAYSAPPEQ